MIGGRGYQALGPHCVLALEHCSAIPDGSPNRLPAARGPPLRPGAGCVSTPIRASN
jgi:hypothetical protein